MFDQKTELFENEEGSPCSGLFLCPKSRILQQ